MSLTVILWNQWYLWGSLLPISKSFKAIVDVSCGHLFYVWYQVVWDYTRFFCNRSMSYISWSMWFTRMCKVSHYYVPAELSETWIHYSVMKACIGWIKCPDGSKLIFGLLFLEDLAWSLDLNLISILHVNRRFTDTIHKKNRQFTAV